MAVAPRKLLSRLAGWIAVPCLTLGLALLLYAVVMATTAAYRSALALEDFDRRRQADAAERAAAAPLTVLAQLESPQRAQVAERSTEPAPDQTLWSPGRVERYEEALFGAPPAEGVLRIPSVSIRVPIFDGTTDTILDVGAGRIEGTPPLGARGNVGIAAHRDGHFRGLKDVEVGAEIVVETLDEPYRYEVFATSIVSPEDTYVLDPTSERHLTLVTCYPFYYVGNAPQRFVVHARGVD